MEHLDSQTGLQGYDRYSATVMVFCPVETTPYTPYNLQLNDQLL